jgi:8-oxo-dGTP pyrophosphatase MutT (NUDIX family)
VKKVLPKDAILIPDNARRVFEGAIFDVYQWPQKLFDGSGATFEMMRRPDTVQVIAVKNDKLVLVDEEQPGRAKRLHFAGGRADEEDDSWEAAAKRELLEETGLSFKNWKLVGVNQPIPKIEWFVPWFLATDLENEQAQNLDVGEKIEVKLLEFQEIHNMVMLGNEPTLNYAMPIFTKINNLAELINLPEFTG